jgi:pimeloyl-ACP methyl ester carboxylesterase
VTDRYLILVPGLLCNDVVWAPQIRELEQLATVTVVDHGHIDTLDGMAEALIERAPARFAIAGHSMGGRVAMEVIRRVPERVLGAALLDSGAHPLRAGEAGEREAAGRYALLEQARNEGMRAMAWTWLQNMVHPSRLGDTELTDPILDMMCTKTPQIFAAQIHALLNRADATPLLPQIRCPTLVLCGQDDLWATAQQHRDIAAQIPDSRLAIIPECGHMSTLERPHAVTEAMREWLKEADGG